MKTQDPYDNEKTRRKIEAMVEAEERYLAALRALEAVGFLQADEHRFFESSYRFLRTIESRLQLMNSTARDQLPQDATEMNKLAHLMRYTRSDALMCDYEKTTNQIRERFDAAFDAAGT